MKISLNEIVSSVEGLKALLDTKLPVKVSYKISKLINNQLNRELKNYEEVRTKLIIELGVKKDNGDSEVVDPEKIKEFQSKLTELLKEEVEIEWEPLSVEDLGDVSIEPKNLPSYLLH